MFKFQTRLLYMYSLILVFGGKVGVNFEPKFNHSQCSTECNCPIKFTASLMILATTEAGRLRSSGLSAMHPTQLS